MLLQSNGFVLKWTTKNIFSTMGVLEPVFLFISQTSFSDLYSNIKISLVDERF